MEELLPGTFTRVFTRVAVGGDMRAKSALEKLARAVETKAKQNLAQSTHRYGTPTPARAGGPPALISGTLRRSVTHTPVVGSGLTNWVTKVGTGTGFFAAYRGKRGTVGGRTPANKYGYYLETGLRNGATYKWLTPAYRWGITVAGPSIWKESFSGKW